MAAATVKATKISGTGTSVSAAVSATATNALIVGGGAFSSGGASGWTVARTGDTFVTDTNGGTVNVRSGIASAPNVVGGSVSCTVSFTGTTSTGIDAWACEVSGLPSSAILDATSPAVTTGSTAAPTSNPLSNATANAIFFSAFLDDGVGNETVTPGTGWSATVSAVTMTDGTGTTFSNAGLEFQIVSSVANQTGTWTESASPGNAWACSIAVYKAVAAGGAGAAPPRRRLLMGVG